MDQLLPILALLLTLFITNSKQNDCSRIEYDRCVKIADPLIKEAHLVFPDNMEDINMVCRTWNRFVDCLKTYTDRCFTDTQRRQFNKAVENPIESVHQMCMQPDYQKEYLIHAPCIKSTITEKSHCGPQYSLLVDQVAQGEIISKAILCCSHDRFKSCVHRETRRLCDRGVQDGPAAKFSGQIIDKALSFLQDQCFNYIPNSGDCMSTADPIPFTDPLMISTAPSEIYPWSTIQESNLAPKEMPPSKMTPPKPPTTWLPATSNFPTDTTYQTDSSSTPMLGSRTRPASYGRSSSWGDTSSGRGQTQSDSTGSVTHTSPTQSSKPDWATISSWNVQNIQNHRPSIETTLGSKLAHGTSETWYPAAGNQLSNEVDEPNQQGLAYDTNRQFDGNGAQKFSHQFMLLTILAAILTIC